MALLEWNDRLELGDPAMDDTHREFVDLLNQLSDSDDADFIGRLDRLLDHTVAHFAQEERWMADSGLGTPCHAAEHHQVIDVCRAVRARVAGGDLAIGRRLAAELAPWFEHHAATKDTILVTHMQSAGYLPERDPVLET